MEHTKNVLTRKVTEEEKKADRMTSKPQVTCKGSKIRRNNSSFSQHVLVSVVFDLMLVFDVPREINGRNRRRCD